MMRESDEGRSRGRYGDRGRRKTICLTALLEFLILPLDASESLLPSTRGRGKKNRRKEKKRGKER